MEKEKCLGCKLNEIITKPLTVPFGKTPKGLEPIKNGAIHHVDCPLSDFYSNFGKLLTNEPPTAQ